MPQEGNSFLLHCKRNFGILLQRVIADFLSVMPPPFLGVSSLNLAASQSPREAAFFFSGMAGGERAIRPPRADRGRA